MLQAHTKSQEASTRCGVCPWPDRRPEPRLSCREIRRWIRPSSSGSKEYNKTRLWCLQNYRHLHRQPFEIIVARCPSPFVGVSHISLRRDDTVHHMMNLNLEPDKLGFYCSTVTPTYPTEDNHRDPCSACWLVSFVLYSSVPTLVSHATTGIPMVNRIRYQKAA